MGWSRWHSRPRIRWWWWTILSKAGSGWVEGPIAYAEVAPRVAAGEAVPQGQSIRARLVIVEIGPGAVDRAALSACQRAGQEGRFAEAMGGFVSWIAGWYEEMQCRLRDRAR